MMIFKRKPDVEKAKNEILPSGMLYLGDKVVEVPKLTPELFKKLTRVTDNLPALAFKLMSISDEETLQAYMVAALDFIADELVAVTAELSGIDAEYLSKNAGMAEIIRYLKATADKNDLTPLVKNLIRLLTKAENTEGQADA